MLAIIEGSVRLPNLEGATALSDSPPATPYGAAVAPIRRAQLAGQPLLSLARHGDSHEFAPHEVNYAANLLALQEQGVSHVLSLQTVGAIADHPCGALVLPDQIIDYTFGRNATYSGATHGQAVAHIDFTEPFDTALRSAVLRAAATAQLEVFDGGTYGCTQGPRLETAAEVRRLGQDGCSLVGMTAMPEAALARELGMPYVSLCLVVNPAAGLGVIDHEEIKSIAVDATDRIQRLLSSLLGSDSLR